VFPSLPAHVNEPPVLLLTACASPLIKLQVTSSLSVH
jgi:hypothetical protein